MASYIDINPTPAESRQPNSDRLKDLYEILKDNGANVGTSGQFRDWMMKSEDNRRQVYEVFKDNGANVGEQFSDFDTWLYDLGQQPTAATQPTAQQTTQRNMGTPGYVPNRFGLPTQQQGVTPMMGATPPTPQPQQSRRQYDYRPMQGGGSVQTPAAEQPAYRPQAAPKPQQPTYQQAQQQQPIYNTQAETPATPEFRNTQKMYSDAADKAWQKAEQDTKALREANTKKIEDIYNDEHSTMLGKMAMAQTRATALPIEGMAASLKAHDMEKMANDAWGYVSDEDKEYLLDGFMREIMREAARSGGSGGTMSQEEAEKALREEAERRAKARQYQAMYDKAVAANAPKDVLDFLQRKIVEGNSLSKLAIAAARTIAGTRGDMDARAVATHDYGKGHRVADIAGSVLQIATDPVTWASGGVGKAATKGVTMLAGKAIQGASTLKRADMIARALPLSQRMIGGSANFAAFEGLGNTVEQLQQGGVYNEETGQYEYSLKDVAKAAGHGVLLGSATGVVGGLVGNVGDKVFDRVASTAGKLAVRGGQTLTSIAAEGTIFAAPELISGEGDFDTWLESVELMAGFKLHHGLKALPGTMGRLMRVPESRAGFETRLRDLLQGRPDLALTNDEREELERGGYTDLSELAEAYKGIEGKLVRMGDEMPYDRFSQLMADNSISEAARAKMYYYVTGRGMVQSTVTAAEIAEHRDHEGNITDYVVKSYNKDGGVITSRTYKSKKAAEVEFGRLTRQSELNSIDMLEKLYDRLPGTDATTAKMLRDVIGRESGIDIDKVIGKEENRRTDEEKAALQDYLNTMARECQDAWDRQHVDVNQQRLQPDWQEAYDMGYKADEQQRSDISIEREDNPNDPQAQAAWQGVEDRIRQDAADRADQRRAEGEKMAYKGNGDMQGMLRPLTINEESSERDPESGERKKKTVYLVNGTIAIEPNGNGLSREGTDKTIYVYDPETGDTHELDPFGGAGVLSVGDVVSMEDYLADNEQQSQAEVQQEIDNATGKVNVAPNTPFVTPEGRQGIVKNVEGDNVIVQFADGGMEEASIPMADLQQYADALRRQEYEARHPQQTPAEQPQQPNTATEGQAPTATAETPTEGEQATEDTRTPAQRTYDDVVAKLGADRASKKIDATAKVKADRLTKAQKALKTAQETADNTEYGSKEEQKAEEAVAKAQAEYDAAQQDMAAWDEVRKLRDQALLAKAEQEDAARKAELERKRAAETEAQRKQREEYEAEQARRREQAERVRQEDAERLKAQIEQEKQEQSNPQPNEPAAPIEGTKGSRSQLEIAREEMADNPEALAMLDDLEPRSLDEIAATLLGGGKRAVKLQREEFKRHTGYSEGEMKRYPFIFASKENGGVTIERLGEMVANEAVNENIPFDELDAMAGANAVLDMLSSVYSQGDINNYIQNKRIAEAREYYNKVKSEAYAMMLDAYGMTEGEYESYMSWLEDAIEQGKSTLSDEEFNQLFNVYEQGQETDVARGNQEGAATTERTESAETDTDTNGERGNSETDAGAAEQAAVETEGIPSPTKQTAGWHKIENAYGFEFHIGERVTAPAASLASLGREEFEIVRINRKASENGGNAQIQVRSVRDGRIININGTDVRELSTQRNDLRERLDVADAYYKENILGVTPAAEQSEGTAEGEKPTQQPTFEEIAAENARKAEEESKTLFAETNVGDVFENKKKRLTLTITQKGDNVIYAEYRKKRTGKSDNVQDVKFDPLQFRNYVEYEKLGKAAQSETSTEQPNTAEQPTITTEPTQTQMADIDNPETWVGHTFAVDGMRLKCKSADNNYSTFDNETAMMGQGFPTDTFKSWWREGRVQEISTTAEQPKQETPKQEPNEPKEPKRLISDEQMDELKERLRKKLRGQLNSGIDPETLSIGLQLAVGHIERGLTKFADFAKRMIEDLGDAIRPYLKSFYNGARDFPGAEKLAEQMTPYDEVRAFDVENFDKSRPSSIVDTAKEIAAEQEIEKQVEKIKKPTKGNKKEDSTLSDTEQGQLDLFGSPSDTETETPSESNLKFTEEQRAKVSEKVMWDMLRGLTNGEKPYKSVADIRKMAQDAGLDVDMDGRDDVALQEMVEDGLVRAARKVIESKRHGGSKSRTAYEAICELYDLQPTISRRSDNRVKMQQYSTPLPMAFVADMFAWKPNSRTLEPTAGNGMLVFAIPAKDVVVNELDETRLANLRQQGFEMVLNEDATSAAFTPKAYDSVIANPPFGKAEAKTYDGKSIAGLDEQIALNALSAMKDNGKAAIIIGGNMEYGSNGAIKSNKAFWTYLYDHYNVKGVVDMAGKLYAKQGTTYPTRMILIDGRRSEEERAQSTIYPPRKHEAIRKAETFEDLYDIVTEVLNSNKKTNGNEVLRSGTDVHYAVGQQRDTPVQRSSVEHHEDVPNGRGRSGRGERVEDVGRNGGNRLQKPEGSGRTGIRESGVSRVPGESTPVSGDGERTKVTSSGGITDGRGQRESADGSRGEQTADGGVERVSVGDVQGDVSGERRRNGVEKKRTLTEEKLSYRPHNSAFSLQSVAPAAMVEAMDKSLAEIESKWGNIDEFVTNELGYDSVEEMHNALAAEQVDSVAMAIYQMQQGKAMIIGDQTGVGKGRQMAALIRWANRHGKKPIFITKDATLFTDIYRDLVDIGSGDLRPFIFNKYEKGKPTSGEMVDADGNLVYKGADDATWKKVLASGELPDEYDFAVLTYSQVNTGDKLSSEAGKDYAKESGNRSKKTNAEKNNKPTPKATFLRNIAQSNYIFLDESHTAAGDSNVGAFIRSIIGTYAGSQAGYAQGVNTGGVAGVTFASATFAKRPDTMPMYAMRTAMSEANVQPYELISIIARGGVTLQEIMSRALTESGQMVRRERDMSDVRTDWETVSDPALVRRARESYDKTIVAFNAIIKFQEDYVTPMIDALDSQMSLMAGSANVKKGTKKMGVENTPFASKTYNYTKQLMLALKVDAIVDRVEQEIKAGRHPVIALESTMENSIKDYNAGDVISEPTFSANLLKGLDSCMQYTVKDGNGNETHYRYDPRDLGSDGERAYYELQEFIRQSTSGVFISPLDAIIEKLHERGYKVGELTGRNSYVERDADGSVVVKKRTDKDKKRMQRDFNSGALDVLILNKSASTGISLHASEKFSDQRQRSMIIAQPLSDINDYMQMIGRIDRTGQVHRGYYINLGLPVPAESRFLMMLSTKLKSLNANTTTSQESESSNVEAPDLLNKYGSQVIVEYLRDNPDIYVKMGEPLKKNMGQKLKANELDNYEAPKNDEVARKITGYVALLNTKEQEDFYNDVVRRYTDLIKYLDSTGTNDLKITVMPLKAKTLSKNVSSEGKDPNGNNPFAQNAYVEEVEMDVLRKPMKADEIRKSIEQLNTLQGTEKGNVGTAAQDKAAGERALEIAGIVEREEAAKLASEEERHAAALQTAEAAIAKRREKLSGQQNISEEEKAEKLAEYTAETMQKVNERHEANMNKIRSTTYFMKEGLRRYSVGNTYILPQDGGEDGNAFLFTSPAIFCGYKVKDSKLTPSTSFAVFATLDGRRRIEVKFTDNQTNSQIGFLTSSNYAKTQQVTLDNWDNHVPTNTRKKGYIMTGNILQAVSDTQDEATGAYVGQLISYTDEEGNIHDGVLMPDRWQPAMLKTSGVPILARLEQLLRGGGVTSTDGKVTIYTDRFGRGMLVVPKTKKEGEKYFNNETIRNAISGGFWEKGGKFNADIEGEDNIRRVVTELSNMGVRVKGDPSTDSEVRFRGEEREREGGEEAAQGDWYDRNSVERIGEFAGYSPKQIAKMNARQEESARKQFNDAADKLHLGDRITFVDTIDEIEGIDERTREARRRKKGWYDPRTGKIVIILGNHKSMDDVMKSILHEGVAHHGLRQMFGEHFNTFLDNVYQNAHESIRDEINAMAKKHGWNFREATEEYLAKLAEDTDFEKPQNQSWWGQVKAWFFDMLHKIGFKLHNMYDTITDNELRYVLWRSYQNLVNPGRFNSVVEEAKDIAKQYDLKVGQWDETWTAAEAEPNATMEYNGRKIPVWAGNGRRKASRKEVYKPGIKLYEIEKIETEAENDGYVEGVGIRMTMTDGQVYRLWVCTDKEEGDYYETTEFYPQGEDEDIPEEEMTERFGDFFGENINKIFGSTIGGYIMTSGRRGFTLSHDEIMRMGSVRSDRTDRDDRNERDEIGNRTERETKTPAEIMAKIRQTYPDMVFFVKRGNSYLVSGEGAKAESAKAQTNNEPINEDELYGIRNNLSRQGISSMVIDTAADGVAEDAAEYAQRDAEYMEAVNSGDMEKAQRMVNEAAKRAMPDTKVVDENGNPLVVYHGGKGKIIVFDKNRIGENLDYGTMGTGFYFTSDRENAENYARNAKGEGEPSIERVFINIRNIKEVNWNELDGKSNKKSEAFTAKAIAKGYDGLTAYAPNGAWWYVAFDPSQIKSADPVTYDDNGNVIPLSQRFNEGNNDIRFRDGEDEETGAPKPQAAEAYERMVSSAANQWKEAMQDSMLSLKKLYQAVSQAYKGSTKGVYRIEDEKGYENAYLAENRMHSMSEAQIHAYQQDYMKPLQRAIHALTGGKREAYETLTDYMMAKHGLERNEVMAKRDAKKAWEEQHKSEQGSPNYTATKNAVFANIDAGVDDLYLEYRKKDYAGLTALTGVKNVKQAEKEAQRMVDEYEQQHDTTGLWKATNRATRRSLFKMLESGLLSPARHAEIRDMYQYYIPLQGFDSDVAEDVYAYMGSDGTAMYGTTIRKAKGRKSKADDPIATIAMNGEAAIRRGNRNLMKQHFLRFVQSHPTDLVSINDVWLRKNANGEWEQYFDADLKETDTPEEVARKVRDFNERMEQDAAANPDLYKRSRDLPNVPFRVLNVRDMAQHQVMVQVDGRNYLLTINGNPRAAQALNGLTNPDVFTEGAFGSIKNATQSVVRTLSQFYTTRNPNFVLSNFLRDAVYTNSMVLAKESPNYALNFHKNFLLLPNERMGVLFASWENGKLREKIANGTASKMEKMFYDFMMNGGETGWTSLRDIEKHKRDLQKALKREGNVAARALNKLGDLFDITNRMIENHARFTAYVTSIEMGRSVERAVWDAKEISVNFNKKGAGDKFLKAKNQTFVGKVGAFISSLGRVNYAFWNASLQGLNNIARIGKRNPAKFMAVVTPLLGLGVAIPLLNALLGGDDDDDKNAYWNLPEYVRRSNICFRFTKDMPWITIPLPIEFRAIYGLGELGSGVALGKEHYSNSDLIKQVAAQFSQVLPLDFMEGGGGWHCLYPTYVKPVIEAYSNKSWTGLPIYRKNTYGQYDVAPEWQRAYSNTNNQIMAATQWLNEATGGDEVQGGVIDLNPARIEYMLRGYLGGYFTVADQVIKMGETATGNREFEWRNMMLANRVVKEGDERTEARKLTNEYFNLKEEYEKTDKSLKAYKKKQDDGTLSVVGQAHYIALMNDSEEYGRYLVFGTYKPLFDAYYKQIKEANAAGDSEEAKRLERGQNELRREMVNIIHDMDNGGTFDRKKVATGINENLKKMQNNKLWDAQDKAIDKSIEANKALNPTDNVEE